MRAFHTSSGYVVRLDRGEEVLSTLAAFLKAEGVSGATLSGIGAVQRTTLGYFDLHKREYLRREFPDDMELVSLTGNLTWVEGEPLIHAHVTISGPDFVAVSGHLFSAEIAITGEFAIVPTGMRLERALDERTGLRLIKD